MIAHQNYYHPPYQFLRVYDCEMWIWKLPVHLVKSVNCEKLTSTINFWEFMIVKFEFENSQFHLFKSVNREKITSNINFWGFMIVKYKSKKAQFTGQGPKSWKVEVKDKSQNCPVHLVKSVNCEKLTSNIIFWDFMIVKYK